MKNLLLVVFACLMMCFSGCATSGNGCCDTGATGIFGQNRLFQNRPIRDAIQGMFQGDACNTCNPPAGIPSNCGSNVAPMCDACGSSLPMGAPIGNAAPIGNGIYNGVPAQNGVSLYDNSMLNAPIETTTGYPNLVDPIITPGAEIGTPAGTIETGYGEIPMGPSF